MRKISRRRFLRSSAMATASGAIALGQILQIRQELAQQVRVCRCNILTEW